MTDVTDARTRFVRAADCLRAHWLNDGHELSPKWRSQFAAATREYDEARTVLSAAEAARVGEGCDVVHKYPGSELKAQVRPFDQTTSVFEVVRKTFFGKEQLGRISDDTWLRALSSAVSQFERYHRRNELGTEEQRRLAVDDALQHAVAIIQMRAPSPAPPAIPEGWQLAIEAAASMLEGSALYYVGVEAVKLVPSKTGEPATHVCAAAVRALAAAPPPSGKG